MTKDMEILDIESLVADLDVLAPCGPDLEYDAAFMQLERDAQGKPEVQFGSAIFEAVSPDWKRVRQGALELLQRSHDLRIAMRLLQANLVLDGVAGLADSLALIEALLCRHWKHVHPQLAADDGFDPTLRINSLAMLQDHASVLGPLKEAVLIELPAIGPLTLRMLELASGDAVGSESRERVSMASLSAALARTDAGRCSTARAAINRSYSCAESIESILALSLGYRFTLDLGNLRKCLQRGRDFLANDAEGGTAGQASGVATDASAIAGHAAPQATAAELVNREEVLHLLDRLVRYYERHEPSSPVPVLLLRARRLVSKSFSEILQDLIPDALPQLMKFKGSNPAE